MSSPRLSVILIARNEEKRIARCLKSITGLADEIVVADTGSTDRTPEIARTLGARIVDEPWQDDFARARNRTIREAGGAWLLWLDADDLVPPEEAARIRALLADPTERAYSLIIENEYEGRPGQSFRQIRLFPAGRGIEFEGRIHETLSRSVARAGLAIKSADIRIRHTGYSLAQDREDKTRRNLGMLEGEVALHPDDPAVLMELGNTHFQLKDYARALDCYNRIAALPASARTQTDILRALPVLLGNACLEKGDLTAAFGHYRDSVTRFPERMAGYYGLLQIAMRLNDAETLLEMAEKIITIPEQVTTVAEDCMGMKANAYAYAANLRFGRKEFERALALFSAADKSGLPPAFRYEIAAEAAEKAGRTDLALGFRQKIGASGEHA